MIRGKKMVNEGNCAILQKVDENFEFLNIEYYKRINNKWIFDEEATNSKISNAVSINNKICEKVDCHEKIVTSKSLSINHEDVNKDFKQTPGYMNSLTNIPVQNTFNCTPSIYKEKDIKSKLIKAMVEEYKHLYVNNENVLEESIVILGHQDTPTGGHAHGCFARHFYFLF
jgi:hypothetical protein